ncbi:unnamed protein product [Haemonchus placei]|uniref:FYVE-type domain-containing protein n=1 Tax=Haemonchus placei TaxID=6290 RepID=A0A0N4W1I5_HAEPC|nr:unnamed protein product [Haemonchus placei]
MTDLGDFPRLQNHVDTIHPERGQDLTYTVIDNVKGKLRNEKGADRMVTNVATRWFQTNESSVMLSYLGVTRSHTEYFRKIRDSSVNESAVRTNMLIIRLDRLINECPCDPSKRKEFEREVVPWSADSESLHCTRCAAKFGIARRKHHCRLCGRVMCQQCSHFLSFLSARKLTNPALAAEMLSNNITTVEAEASPSHSRRLLEMTQKTTGKVISFIEGAVAKIQTTDGSEISLGSLLQQDAQECLRICGSCMMDLSRREQMMEQRNPPVLAEQYETLDRMIAEASAMVPSYARMSESIKYVLITSRFALGGSECIPLETITYKRSYSIVAEAENESCGVKEAQLRKNIRFACVQTLQVLP